MNTIPLGALFGLLIVLILMSGFFSGSETALMSLNRYRLRHLAKNGHKGAMRTAKLLQQPERLISLILLGNNFVNILASAIATVIALRILGEPGIAVATGILTLVILVFAEVTPKTLATLKTEQIAFFASAVYLPLMKVTWPLVRVINWFVEKLLRLLGVSQAADTQEELTRAELATVVNESAGMIPQRHRDMLINILDLEEISVDEIMVPRNDISAIDLDDSWDEILTQVSNSQHGRLVVYRENIDNLVGFIYLRKMLDTMRAGDFNREALEARIRDAYFIPEGTSLTVQLLNFQKENRRIGLVVDEYGDILGLLTLEDILEEIVGEFANDKEDGMEEIQPQPDGSFLVAGTTQVRTLHRALDWPQLELSVTGPKTLNGLVLEHLESFPSAGSVFKLQDHQIEILDVEENRVSSVRITPFDSVDSGDSAGDAGGQGGGAPDTRTRNETEADNASGPNGRVADSANNKTKQAKDIAASRNTPGNNSISGGKKPDDSPPDELSSRRKRAAGKQ